MKPAPATLFAAGTGIVALAAIVAGFLVIGSPREIRRETLDRIRANDLAAISQAITAYRLTHEELPVRLDDLIPATHGATPRFHLNDPAGRAYTYAITGPYSYELCATFDTASAAPAADGSPRDRSLFAYHGRGRHCFAQEARPPARR